MRQLPERARTGLQRRASERGATAIEYGLLCALMVIVLLVGLTNFAGTSTNGFNGTTNKLTAAMSGAR